MSGEISTAVQSKKVDASSVSTTYIDPFLDWSFKRIFASEESKPILIGLLNQIFKGRKFITAIEFCKNERPRENAKQRGVVFDVTCTDADGSKFIIEVQRAFQEFYIDRALYYASTAITDQAKKVKGKKWNYKLDEVYVISFLENFILPNSFSSAYVHDICLTNRHTGKIFHEKLGFIFIEMLSFVKSPAELETDLDKWLYALKHLTEFKERPQYLSGSEFDPLFDLAEYANFNEEERKMYNDSLKHKWDTENVMDFAVKTAREEERAKAENERVELKAKAEKERVELKAKAEKEKREMAISTALKLKKNNVAIELIADATGLSVKEIEAL